MTFNFHQIREIKVTFNSSKKMSPICKPFSIVLTDILTTHKIFFEKMSTSSSQSHRYSTRSKTKPVEPDSESESDHEEPEESQPSPGPSSSRKKSSSPSPGTSSSRKKSSSKRTPTSKRRSSGSSSKSTPSPGNLKYPLYVDFVKKRRSGEPKKTYIQENCPKCDRPGMGYREHINTCYFCKYCKQFRTNRSRHSVVCVAKLGYKEERATCPICFKDRATRYMKYHIQKAHPEADPSLWMTDLMAENPTDTEGEESDEQVCILILNVKF